MHEPRDYSELVDQLRAEIAAKDARIAGYRYALVHIAAGQYNNFAGDPSEWVDEIAYTALGGRHEKGQRIDAIYALADNHTPRALDATADDEIGEAL